MRLDSPGCIHCKYEDIQIRDDGLHLSTFGIYSHIPIKFVLDLEFEQAVNASLSRYEIQSLGHIYFELQKQSSETLWYGVEKEQKRKIPIWWDMREKYSTEMDEWSDMMENRETEIKEQKRKQRKEEREKK